MPPETPVVYDLVLDEVGDIALSATTATQNEVPPNGTVTLETLRRGYEALAVSNVPVARRGNVWMSNPWMESHWTSRYTEEEEGITPPRSKPYKVEDDKERFW